MYAQADVHSVHSHVHTRTHTHASTHRHKNNARPPLLAHSTDVPTGQWPLLCDVLLLQGFFSVQTNCVRLLKGSLGKGTWAVLSCLLAFWHCPHTHRLSLAQWDINTSDLKETVDL